MADSEYDRLAFELAKQFFVEIKYPGITPELIEKDLNPPALEMRSQTLNGIYLRLLVSAQNANMKAGVIGGSIDGVENLGKVLFDFEPKLVVQNFKDNSESVFEEIKSKLKPRGELRTGTKSLWPKYCKTILSGAEFLAQFNSADEFYQWVKLFDSDDKTRVALPMLLAEEIYGFGFPLACDFLKEQGFINFAKPDVHLRDIFEALNLCVLKASDYQIFKAIIRVAKHANQTPYAVDRIFWLIGSGRFPNIDTGNRKDKFIEFAKGKLLPFAHGN